jgi:hypothetical protein
MKENGLIINDRKEHCPQQTSENKITQVKVVSKEYNLSNNNTNQANGIIDKTNSTIKSRKRKILKVFHQNI